MLVVHWYNLLSGITLGSGLAAKDIVGEVSVQQIYELARLKQQDAHLSLIPLESLAKNIVGTARSMGIRVCTTYM